MNLPEFLENTARDIDIIIQRHFADASDELNKASAHLLLAGGKRLRPAMLMLSADASKKGSSFDLVPAALSMELIHTFTLIHDDIMDRDTERRGVETVQTKWDEPTAILAGDVLYARAFEFLCLTPASDSARMRAVSLLARTCAQICEGQYLDMSFEYRDNVTESEYIDMVQKKTGALFAASAAIGGILAGGRPMQIDALHKYGLLIGIAFQIQDDIIDMTSTTGRTGKDRASDIREGKETLIAIRARDKGLDISPYQRDLNDGEVDELVSLLTEAGIIEEVRGVARSMIAKGAEMIGVVPESPEKQLLFEIGKFFISREN